LEIPSRDNPREIVLGQESINPPKEEKGRRKGMATTPRQMAFEQVLRGRMGSLAGEKKGDLVYMRYLLAFISQWSEEIRNAIFDEESFLALSEENRREEAWEEEDKVYKIRPQAN
jgi:hypothetical protein